MQSRLGSLKNARSFNFARFIWRRFDETGITQAAGSLTFTTLLALVPVLAIMLVVVTAFPMFDDLVTAFLNFVNSIIVPSGATAVSDYLETFKLQAGKLTTIGIIAMLITVLMLIQTIEQIFNRIWAVRQQRSWWIRLPAYIALLILVPLGTGISLTLSAIILPFDSLAREYPLFSGSLKSAWQIALDTLALALLYRTVPNSHVPLRHAFSGALLTAICLEGAKWGFGVYLRHFNSYELVYGAFAVVPVFLIWLHLLWTIVLTGALLTACSNYWHGGAFERTDAHTLFDDVISMMLLLTHTYYTEEFLRVRHFRQQLNIGYDRIERILQHLEKHGYVQRLKYGWQLNRQPENILLSDLFALFVYDTHDKHGNNPILREKMQTCVHHLNTSLADLYQQQK
ncbi:YihY family inner membrane protein [Wielerella bovis]|uniref:YihY family inner membrane protein n=1 Tax=Wielerella bovis TaxID=2917790 RepID=UPI0020186BF0|nr:YihY family inner membrane protein [Wielerella bovis]ULJ68903.1 YihY family inner membrane protein [Wielerella bovis]